MGEKQNNNNNNNNNNNKRNHDLEGYLHHSVAIDGCLPATPVDGHSSRLIPGSFSGSLKYPNIHQDLKFDQLRVLSLITLKDGGGN